MMKDGIGKQTFQIKDEELLERGNTIEKISGSNSTHWHMVKWLSRVTDTHLFPVRVWMSQQD
jgi:hypothetical protein